MKNQGFYIAIIWLLIGSCTSYKNKKPTDFSGNYKRNKIGFDQKYKAFLNSETSAQIHFLFQSQELLHTRSSSNEGFYYKVEISYRLYSNYERKIIADSSKIVIQNKSDPYLNKEIQGYFNVSATKGSSFLLEIKAKDVFRNQEYTQFMRIDRSANLEETSFLVYKNERIVFNEVFYVGDTLSLHTIQANTKYMIQYFYKNFAPATPPFTFHEENVFTFDKDSLFEIQANDSIITLVLPKKGLYYIRKDTSLQNGFSMVCFDKSEHPIIQTQAALIGPLRYITSKKEYTDMDVLESKKGFEQFWLNITGNNPERSRALIKEYYKRVSMANELFTSFTEGWKTDRGMMYIVFGEPNAVYKSADLETWIYGHEGSFNSVSFSFSLVQNPLSKNDYLLNRSNIYRNSYYKAVDLWRQGRIEIQN